MVLEQTSLVSDCVTEAAKELGYPVMKPEQLDVTMAFVEDLQFFQLALERVCATPACQWL